jgi:hypothetical protein
MKNNRKEEIKKSLKELEEWNSKVVVLGASVEIMIQFLKKVYFFL